MERGAIEYKVQRGPAYNEYRWGHGGPTYNEDRKNKEDRYTTRTNSTDRARGQAVTGRDRPRGQAVTGRTGGPGDRQ